MFHVDPFYLRLAGICLVIGLLFFFITTESLVRGKLRLPAWVFSSFTLTLGVFFFHIFINSVSEFGLGHHETLDELIDAWQLLTHFIGSVGLLA